MRETDVTTNKRLQIQKLDELPPMPFPPGKILDLLSFSYEAASVSELADIIKLSPPLSARLVGLANTAYFHGRHPVHTVNDAITRIGLRMVKGLTLAVLLSSPFKPESVPNFPVKQYWREAVMTATCASQLASHMHLADRPFKEEVYLAGLLHNLGLLVLAHVFPQDMARIFANAPCCDDITLVQQERSVLCTDHHQAATWILRKWHVPERLLIAAQHYHEPGYRENDWQLCLLIGFCTRWIQQSFAQIDERDSAANTLSALAIGASALERARHLCEQQSTKLDELAELLSQGGKMG